MCAVKGPVVLHEEPEDGEFSPRSTISSASNSSSSSGYGSAASSLELDSSSPVWQRSIPKGRRCKPLSFSGMILYDENGKQVELSLEDLEEDEDGDEYFSSQRNLAEREAEFQTPTSVK